MSEYKHNDGSVSVGILEDAGINVIPIEKKPVEKPVESVEKPKKKTTKKK